MTWLGRAAQSGVLLAMLTGSVSCHRGRGYASPEPGCGAGAYSGAPVQRRVAQWPDPSLDRTQSAGLYVGATDAATGRAAVPLNIWIIVGADTVKARTRADGAAEFSRLPVGPAEVRAWFFNFASTRDSIVLRSGFRDSVVLRLGRTGQECLIVPDTARRAHRRQPGP